MSTVIELQSTAPTLQHYVLGFLFDAMRENVILIEKTKPDWQIGRLNGVGGKIEKQEKPVVAMIREFNEEAGVTVPVWQHHITLASPTFKMHVFGAIDQVYFQSAITTTEEQIIRARVDQLPNNVLPNLRWMIPLILDTELTKPIHLQAW